MNGKLIRISQEARQKGKLLKRCYHELLETVDAYFLANAIPDLEKMRALLARFDRTWVEFEKLYFEEREPRAFVAAFRFRRAQKDSPSPPAPPSSFSLPFPRAET